MGGEILTQRRRDAECAKGSWKLVRLGELCSKIGSGATPSGGKNAYREDGISLIRSQNVLDFNFSTNGLAFINEEQARKLDGVTVKPKDVLLNITGDSVARVCIVPDSVLPARVNQHVCILRPRENVLDSGFLAATLISIKQQLLLMAGSGATRNALTKGDISELKISLPPLPTQRKIAAVLGALDDKIENNRKICANLEAQAQAIFKSWFVDFEPFGGKMPQGWKMGKLGDVCKIFDSRRIPLSSLQRAEMQGDIPYYGATSIVDYVNDFLLEGIYLLMGEDGSVITDKGYPFLQYIWGKFWPNNHAHVLQGTNGYTTEMLYCLLSQTKVERYVTGAVQPKISQGNMIMIPACIPEGSDAKKFSGMIQPLFDELRCITDESRALAATRDTLLPKLMSGEIDVEKVKVA